MTLGKAGDAELVFVVGSAPVSTQYDLEKFELDVSDKHLPALALVHVVGAVSDRVAVAVATAAGGLHRTPIVTCPVEDVGVVQIVHEV